ncbi:MAG TPA: D-erythronate dehydrogenase [Azospirillaceae bacterium]|nr:D-erythronate dehydrogenase [Azospirillaceae bacterium]
MRVVITGGGGFIGQKLAKRLAADGRLCGRPISSLVLFDMAAPPVPAGSPFPIEAMAGDIADPAGVARLFAGGADAVYHLAAVVSGAAEADFDLGYRVNLDGTRRVLEACRTRATGGPTRLVFAASCAAFGGGSGVVVRDDTVPRPQTSYGTQKVIGEYLVNDYSRKGHVDGRSLRLPTIAIRPGAPNAAASGFVSSIVREPLQGRPAVCPVEPETEAWVLSPRRLVDALVRAVELPAEAWGGDRTVNLPGLTVSVAQQLDALRRAGGDTAVQRVRFEPDARVRAIVDTWPTRYETVRGTALGFERDADVDAIVQAFVADDLAG